MKKHIKINPVAKSLREPSYRNRTIPNKKKNKLGKQLDKELRDAKTTEDK